MSMKIEIPQSTQEDFGNLAPLMNVVSIAGYLNPKLVDEDTIATIANTTGTPPDLVECIVDAVDEVNEMIGNGEDEEKVLKNFSRAMSYMGSCCQGTTFRQPQACGPFGLSKIAFALNEEVVANFSSEDLASYVSTFVPVNFESAIAAFDTVKSNVGYSPRQNFSRRNYNVVALGGALKQAAGQALKSLGNIKNAVAGSDLGKQIVKTVSTAKDSITNSQIGKEAVKTVVGAKDAIAKAAPGIKSSIIVGAEKGLQAAKAEIPHLKETGRVLGKSAGQFFKDIVHSPFMMGLDGELANVGRLKAQKVISQTAADFLNKVKGIRSFDLSNATLEAEIIKSGVMNTKAAMGAAAKQLKAGEISQDYFRSLTKDFQGLLSRNLDSLKNIRGSSLKKITDVATKNKDFITKSADLTSKFNAGALDANTFSSQFESLLKRTTGTFKDDALYLFRNATDKGKAARDILKNARADDVKVMKEIKKITDNFNQVEKLVKTELSTAVPMATSQLGQSVPGKFLATLRGLPDQARQSFILKGVKSCQPEMQSVNPLMKKADAVIKDAKSVLGKTALVGIGTAVPAGMIYWGLNADEDKALSLMVDRAEALKIEIKQTENKIAALSNQLEAERESVGSLPASKKSGKYGGAYGLYEATTNFSALNFALPAPLAAVAKTLLFPIAPAVLTAALGFVGVAVVQDKIAKIQYREHELENELALLAMKRNQLNMELSRIEQNTKRFHMGTDYLGYSNNS